MELISHKCMVPLVYDVGAGSCSQRLTSWGSTKQTLQLTVTRRLNIFRHFSCSSVSLSSSEKMEPVSRSRPLKAVAMYSMGLSGSDARLAACAGPIEDALCSENSTSAQLYHTADHSTLSFAQVCKPQDYMLCMRDRCERLWPTFRDAKLSLSVPRPISFSRRDDMRSKSACDPEYLWCAAVLYWPVMNAESASDEPSSSVPE